MWAKSTPHGAWHPLWCHLLDVAASTWEILLLEPASTLTLFARDWDMSAETVLPWISFLTGLHDIGKATPCFQQKHEPGMMRAQVAGLSWVVAPAPNEPHGVTGHAALKELLGELGLGPSAAKFTSAALGAHHGWRATDEQVRRCKDPHVIGGPAWKEVRRELLEYVREVVGVAAVPQVDKIGRAAYQRLAGLTSFADWIGSGLEFGDSEQQPQAYFVDARQRAKNKLTALGWHPRLPLQPAPKDFASTFDYLAPGCFRPRPLQTAVEQMVDGCDGPTLLLIEAPMGEGKSEAAFYASAVLQRKIGHRGLYAAMPTRATGNAMFTRTRDFVRSCGRHVPVDLQLLHGATLLNDDYQQLLYRANDPLSAEDGVTAAQYFSHRKRALLSEYGVGTVDQALITVLPVKHQFVRLWGLGNRVVMLDEVHAYDAYTGTLIEYLLQWLRALGSSVVLLSATLPKSRREALLQCWGGQVAESVVYPRVTCVSNRGVQQRTFGSRPQPLVELRSAPGGLPDVIPAILTAAESGGCVGCIVNTVDRAQKLYTLLRDRDPDLPVVLFHARFPLEDRQCLEERVLGLFGKDGARPARAVLVATQVVEQSLDLDFDVIFSDLAPVDLLLQRLGRLHRHEDNVGKRHSHEKPVLHVLGLQGHSELPGFKQWGWDRVYQPLILTRTWMVLRDASHVDLAADIEPLVETVYSEWVAEWASSALIARLADERAQLDLLTQTQNIEASRCTIGLPDERSLGDSLLRCSDPEDGAEKNTAFVATRDCLPSAVIVPLYEQGKYHSLDRAGTDLFSLEEIPDLKLAKQLFCRSLNVSNQRIVHALAREAPPPKSWASVPLLRGLYALPLKEDGTTEVGGTPVRLDPELGLVYGERKAEEVC